MDSTLQLGGYQYKGKGSNKMKRAKGIRLSIRKKHSKKHQKRHSKRHSKKHSKRHSKKHRRRHRRRSSKMYGGGLAALNPALLSGDNPALVSGGFPFPVGGQPPTSSCGYEFDFTTGGIQSLNQ